MGVDSGVATRMFQLIILVVCGAALVSAEPEGVKATERTGKVFFVSSTTSTSILSTVNFCYVSSATMIGACKRKRRDSIMPTDAEISPASSRLEAEDTMPLDFDVSQREVELDASTKDEMDADRVGRFQNYWITTTITSTRTSYTTTSTFYSLGCTPSGFPYINCQFGAGK